MNTSAEQIKCNIEHADVLSCAKKRVKTIRQSLKKAIDHCRPTQSFPRNKSFSRVIALSLMAEKVSRFNDDISNDIFWVATSYIKDWHKTHASNIQWKAEDALQIEQSLWRIYIDRELNGTPLTYKDQLSNLFRTIALESNKSHVLCLMLWLFPELVTEDRIDIVEKIEMKEYATWMQQDKILLWGVRIRHMDCSQEKARDIEAKILRQQLDSGGFASTEEGAHADLISSACALLTLVSCVRLNGSEDAVLDAAQKTARWVFDKLSESQEVNESSAWALYALSEFVRLYRSRGH